MSHFGYYKPSGVWTDGTDTVDAVALEYFENAVFKSVNGDDGGTWAPTVPVAIGGAGIQTGPFKLTAGSSSAADTTALKAITGMQDGHVCFVRKVGLYIYTDPDSTAESLPWVVSPTSGSGRWFHVIASLRNAAAGFVASDAALPAAVLANKVIGRHETFNYFASTQTPGASESSITGVSVLVPSVAIGDVLECALQLGQYDVNGGGRWVATAVQAPSSAITDGSNFYLPNTGGSANYCFRMRQRFTATEAGTYTALARTAGGGEVFHLPIGSHFSLEVTHFR